VRYGAAGDAAVDDQLRACHLTGGVGSDKQYTVDDVLRVTGVVERHSGFGDLMGSIGVFCPAEAGILVQIGVLITPGLDGVDANPVTRGGALHRHRLGKFASLASSAI
jgi:hypothetical protein